MADMPDTRLANSPLVHVITQVAFTQVLDLGDSIKGVQAQLREFGFVKLRTGQGQRILIQDGIPQKVESVIRWEFTNKDDSLSCVLTEDFVALQTSRYSHFGKFSRELAEVLGVLDELSPVSWVERIGLRYVNRLELTEGQSYSDYLRRELLGFPFDEAGSFVTGQVQFATQAVAETKYGRLAVRTYPLPDGVGIPADLLPNGLKYPKRSVGGPSVALDIDHFSEADHEFSPETILSHLNGLHSLTKETFRAAVTATALDRWGPEEPL